MPGTNIAFFKVPEQLQRGSKKKLNDNKNSHVLVEDEMNLNQETKTKNIKKLLKIYQDKKIFLIWDGASWHKSKEIRVFLSETNKGKTRIELFNFPPYTPEFNPQEHVWKALRQKITHNRLEKDFPVLIKDCLKFLKKNNFSSIKFENLFGCNLK